MSAGPPGWAQPHGDGPTADTSLECQGPPPLPADELQVQEFLWPLLSRTSLQETLRTQEGALLTLCVALDKSLNLSELPFYHPSIKDNPRLL